MYLRPHIHHICIHTFKIQSSKTTKKLLKWLFNQFLNFYVQLFNVLISKKFNFQFLAEIRDWDLILYGTSEKPAYDLQQNSASYSKYNDELGGNTIDRNLDNWISPTEVSLFLFIINSLLYNDAEMNRLYLRLIHMYKFITEYYSIILNITFIHKLVCFFLSLLHFVY